MATIKRFQQALGLLAQEVKGDINLEQLRIVIEVMAHHPEPLGLAGLAEIIGGNLGRIKQHSELLGEKLLPHHATKALTDIGLGLVETRPDPYEAGKEVLVLTKKGLALKARLVAL